MQNAAPDDLTAADHVWVAARLSTGFTNRSRCTTSIKGFAGNLDLLRDDQRVVDSYDYRPRRSANSSSRQRNGGVSLGLSADPGSPPHFFGALITKPGLPVQMVQYRGTSIHGGSDVRSHRSGVPPATCAVLHHREEGACVVQRMSAGARIARRADAGRRTRARDAGDVVRRRGAGRHATADHRPDQREFGKAAEGSGAGPAHHRDGMAVRTAAARADGRADVECQGRCTGRAAEPEAVALFEAAWLWTLLKLLKRRALDPSP